MCVHSSAGGGASLPRPATMALATEGAVLPSGAAEGADDAGEGNDAELCECCEFSSLLFSSIGSELRWLMCGHVFHTECITNYLEGSGTTINSVRCPICKVSAGIPEETDQEEALLLGEMPSAAGTIEESGAIVIADATQSAMAAGGGEAAGGLEEMQQVAEMAPNGAATGGSGEVAQEFETSIVPVTNEDVHQKKHAIKAVQGFSIDTVPAWSDGGNAKKIHCCDCGCICDHMGTKCRLVSKIQGKLRCLQCCTVRCQICRKKGSGSGLMLSTMDIPENERKAFFKACHGKSTAEVMTRYVDKVHKYEPHERTRCSSNQGRPVARPINASASSQSGGAVGVPARPDGVPLHQSELEMLHTCLLRFSESQKRLCDALNTITDKVALNKIMEEVKEEKKITEEVKGVVMALIHKEVVHKEEVMALIHQEEVMAVLRLAMAYEAV